MNNAAARSLALAALAALAAAGCHRDEADWDPAAVTVRTELALEGPHQATLVLAGTLRPAESVPIDAPRSGNIAYPNRFAGGLRTGDAVAAGEVVAFLENEESRLQLAESRLRAEAARADLERTRRGFDAGLFPQAELAARESEARLAEERLASAEREAKRLALTAPRTGRLVVAQPIPPGSAVTPSQRLAEVASTGALRVEAQAAAADRARLRPGLAVSFVAAGATEPFGEGSLLEVAPVVDSAGTVRVVARIDTARGSPAPGEGVELRVALERKAMALTVAEDAIVAGSRGSGVFVAERSEEGARRLRVRRVAVETGGRGNGRVEIRKGIVAGDRVVVSGAALLADGSIAVEAPVESKVPASAASAASSALPPPNSPKKG